MGMGRAHLAPSLYPPETVRSVCRVVFLLDIPRACKHVLQIQIPSKPSVREYLQQGLHRYSDFAPGSRAEGGLQRRRDLAPWPPGSQSRWPGGRSRCKSPDWPEPWPGRPGVTGSPSNNIILTPINKTGCLSTFIIMMITPTETENWECAQWLLFWLTTKSLKVTVFTVSCHPVLRFQERPNKVSPELSIWPG